MEDGLKLTDEQIRLVITTLIFAGYRSTVTTLVRVFKFLQDNPKVFSVVKEEHMAIQNAEKVIKETMRLVPIVKLMSRVSLEDVEYNGYVILKGWRAYVSYHFHFDPKLFPHPQKFDPSRFNEPTKPNTFIPFGSARHLCVGYEFANSVIPLVIHRVITNFSFEREGVNEVLFWPHYIPKDGYPLKFKRLTVRI